jgi:hypothetical protein
MSHSLTTITNSTHETLTPDKGAEVEAEEMLANAVVEVNQVTAQTEHKSLHTWLIQRTTTTELVR